MFCLISNIQTFPVWTQETLTDLRERKMEAEEKAVEAMDRLKDASIKMEQKYPIL